MWRGWTWGLMEMDPWRWMGGWTDGMEGCWRRLRVWMRDQSGVLSLMDWCKVPDCCRLSCFWLRTAQVGLSCWALSDAELLVSGSILR